MTKHKQYPPRSYETFPDHPDESLTRSPASYQRGGDTDKSRSAAAEAQRLGSQGSWADNLMGGGTPATNRTPAASTVDGDEARDVRYPNVSREPDLSDPPPVYTPSASTQANSQSPATPSSPVAARSVPAPPSEQPVSAPVTVSSSSHSRPQCSLRDDDDRSSSLPEPVQHQYPSQNHLQHDESESEGLPVFMQRPNNQSSRRWCRGPRKRRGCGGGRRNGRHCHDKHRARRFKRACFFIFALLLCLWLMIPGLCKSLSNVMPSSVSFTSILGT